MRIVRSLFYGTLFLLLEIVFANDVKARHNYISAVIFEKAGKRDGKVVRHIAPSKPNHPFSSSRLFPIPPPNVDIKGLRENITLELQNKIKAIESRFSEEMRIVENRMMNRIDDIKRKGENEIKKLVKLIRVLSTRVHRFQRHEYIYVNEPESWYDAESNCQKWSGHLVSINSEAENNFVKNLHSWYVWIGLNDIVHEDRFVWTELENPTFQLWKPGQPDNKETNENCADQDKNGEWSDRFCYLSRHYVCERPSLNNY